MARTCPRCAVELVERDVDGILVDECDGCRGVFLERGELGELSAAPRLDAARAAFTDVAPAPGGTVYGKCPVCATLMKRRKFATGIAVIVDECVAHGTWFDGAELARVVEFLADGGAERARARDAARDREEARRASTGDGGLRVNWPARPLNNIISFLAPHFGGRQRRR